MYYSIQQGNQRSILLNPSKSEEWIEQTIRNYSWEKYDMYDNRLDEYMEHLFDVLPNLGNSAEDDIEFWEQLSRGQKIFYTFLIFEGCVEDAGILDFFWNRTEYIYAFEEVLNILQVEPLLKDYEALMVKFEEFEPQITELQQSINYNNKKWQEQYDEAYQKVEELCGEDFMLDVYFWEEPFRKQFHKAMCDYIENNRNEFISHNEF